MQRLYKCLSNLEYVYEDYKLIVIRDEDMYPIMQWRNEQIDILRQKEPLTKEKQEWYFRNVVDKLFEVEKPNQLLFGFLENDILIGYGGFVHIDWESQNAEISFLTDSKRLEPDMFSKDWESFLNLIKRIANLELDFTKIYTYSYDIRPKLYQILKKNNFIEEARLKNHISINDKQYDVFIHSYFFEPIFFRMANQEDVTLYFKWVNDSSVRNNSLQNEPVKYEGHYKWFISKLNNENYRFYLFFNKQNTAVGQVRIESEDSETIIGISVDESYRGKSLSSKMLVKATNDFFARVPSGKIFAYIKKANISSYKSFISAGFTEQSIVVNNGITCHKLVKKNV